MSRFIREYRLLIGKPGSTGVLLTENQITFDIKKTADSSMNTATFRIFNLAPDTRQKLVTLEEEDGILELQLGYRGDDKVRVFLGNIITVVTSSSGADIVTEIICGDGYSAYRDAKTNRNFPDNTKAGSVILGLIQDMGLSAGVIKGNIVSHVFNNGYTTTSSGRAANEMDKLVYGFKDPTQWSVQDTVVHVLPKGESSQETALLINEGSGLIGNPQRTGKPVGKEKGSNVSSSGVQMITLLNPEIVINRPIRLESRYITGDYICKELNHVGDYEGGTWHTNVKLESKVTE